ncbi:MAG: acyl-CoA thioesterase [Anaerolineales bacterium]|nr:acyl-CoA thioesterase [Anaerolineales bacterium]
MTLYKFSYPLTVRYSDLDAQGHVNNATYFTYLEQGRLEYLKALGLWKPGQDFMAVGTIVAEASCTYKRPILLDQVVEIAVRTARLGTKSAVLEYQLTVAGVEVATGRTVQVAYDYRAGVSIAIPADWRAAVLAFEGAALAA